jgi:phage-related protein
MEATIKPVPWVGSSRRDLRAFPRPVQREIGQALYTAQMGRTDPAARPMRGFGGASVMEIVADFDGDTWRAIYAVRFADVLYVLHTFQKKSKKGIGTPQRELETIRRRLAEAERDYRGRTK